jgi:para-nitrobenzyl esterase
MTTSVQTPAGPIRGESMQNYQRFRGIPFARPPVGGGRFRAPEPIPDTGEVIDATAYGLAAPQHKSALPGMEPGPQGDDCLSLNVFTPAADGNRRPVMFWIHGGAFTAGSSAQALYDGEALCTRGQVVVVTINYRLGALGYLYADGAAPNTGQLDQIAALEWVRRNISAFGGDPDNVTIFGESAGGMAVSTLLAMPAAARLFHKAIPQSGAALHTLTAERARKIADSVFEAAQVDDLEQLSALPIERVLAAQSTVAAANAGVGGGLCFAPVLDGASLPTHPNEAVANGVAAGVPLLVGSNLDEHKLFNMGMSDQIDADTLRRRTERLAGGDRAERMIDAYRQARDGRGASTTAGEILDAIHSDHAFRIPAIRLLEAQAPHQQHTYAYLFTWKSPARRGALGACHALELPFVWGTLEAPGMPRFAGAGPEAETLSSRMMDAWIAFAHTGSPACDALPPWPAYDAATRATMIFDQECRAEDAPLDRERSSWS